MSATSLGAGNYVKISRSVFFGALIFSTSQLGAQSFHLGLRGGGAFPTGAFSEPAVGCGSSCNGVIRTLNAARNGFGYGLDAGIQLGIAGVYAGFNHVDFECESYTCNSEGRYTLHGATAGLKLLMPGTTIVRPWLKGGVTFDQLEGGWGAGQLTELKTERKPGYEVGAGLDIDILGFLIIAPQARYLGQNFKYKVPGISTTNAAMTQGANYLTFDVGLSVHNLLGIITH